MNVFSWSLPFLAEKVSSMLYSIVKKCTDLDNDKDDVNLKEKMKEEVPADVAAEKQKKRMQIRGKI